MAVSRLRFQCSSAAGHAQAVSGQWLWGANEADCAKWRQRFQKLKQVISDFNPEYARLLAAACEPPPSTPPPSAGAASILDTIVGGKKGKRQREDVVRGLLTIDLKRGRAAPGE